MLVVALGMLAFATLAAQTSKTNDLPEVRIRHGIYIPPSASISAQSNLVQLGVVVRDHKGQPVSGMNASDFELFDDGKPQRITIFSEQRADDSPLKPVSDSAASSSKAPSTQSAASPRSGSARASRSRYIALFVDDDHSELLGLRKSELAIDNLISSSLQPNDHVALFTTSGAGNTDFTTDTKRLRAAVDSLRPHVHRGDEAITSCPSLTSYQAYVIANNLDLKAKEIAVAETVACNCPPNDSACPALQVGLVENMASEVWDQTKYRSTNALKVLQIALRHLAEAPGDRVLLLVSPGFITGEMEQQTSAIIDAALRNHIVINSLDSEGLLFEGESAEGLRIDSAVRQLVLGALMSTASTATGGRFIQNNNDLKGSLHSLATVSEVSYVLGFSPPAKPDGKYHHLKLQLNNHEPYTLQAREGYFYSTSPEYQSAQKQLDHEVASHEELHQIPIAVRVSSARERNGQFAIGVMTTIDATHLKFAKQNGRSNQQLTFVAILRDSEGGYVTGKEAVMDLSLTTNTLASLRTKGIKAKLSFTAPQGSYEVREVVREVVGDRLASANTPIQCR